MFCEDNLFCGCLCFYDLQSTSMRMYFKLFPKGSRCQIRFLLLLFSSLGICQARKSRDPADDGRSPENATHCRRERYVSCRVRRPSVWGQSDQLPVARIGAVAALFLLRALGVERERCVVWGVACRCTFMCTKVFSSEFITPALCKLSLCTFFWKIPIMCDS